MSHPVWVRGLKHAREILSDNPSYVAPRVGAWIETDDTSGFNPCQIQVAPRVGAWIETSFNAAATIADTLKSHPVWVRGLKPAVEVMINVDGGSHPVWVRGLKLTNRS